jgi:ATP-dependent Lhr-like helicase
VSAFDLLHPALQHHIVNSLGWPSLRPLQEQAIEPILNGEHTLLVAPTAGGKTEAAVFPLFSRMLSEDWRGLGLLYICPLRALLNNLAVRLGHYCTLLGRRADLWHGDIGDSVRRRMLEDPPDILLVTPESLEVILVSRRHAAPRFFRDVRAVVVDEIHSFAGDDRGWHLLAVLERITRLAGRDLQRLGLSATVGQPERLLGWLVGSSEGPRRVIAPADVSPTDVDVTLDYVGTLDNATTVISQLHRGEKRLVFCDSRSRVEEIATRLREAGVETYVSHSSLGRDERRRAEEAFAQGHDCVIVATSTLELGIDVGDLDRVIQVDAPWTVSSFLQRLGRTGRRAGTRRYCLFLTTSEESFLRAAAILRLWSDGFVEPVEPPVLPFHMLAQQVMALALQEGGIGTTAWAGWIGRMPGFAAIDEADRARIVSHMLESGILAEDSGLLWLGGRGEATFGRRHFMELFTSFISEPMVAVRHGRTHLGQVDASTFALRHEEVPVILLGGRSWAVTHIDWDDRIAYVEPAKALGKSRWPGTGQPLHYELCQAIRRILTGTDPTGTVSVRARSQLEAVRADYSWLASDRTVVLRDASGLAWWTFGGLRANAALADFFRRRGLDTAKADNFRIHFGSSVATTDLENHLHELTRTAVESFRSPVEETTIEGLKFSQCLPRETAVKELQERLTDRPAITSVLAEPVVFVGLVES